MSPPQTTPATIEVRLGQAAGTRRELNARTSVGRSTSADLPLDHVSVSRKHAEFVPLPEGRWLLKDLGSRNGTSVNGDLISERVLRDGDQIAVGEMVLHFSQPTESRIAADEEDAPGFTLTSFDRARSSSVSADHVAAIVAFGASPGRRVGGGSAPEIARTCRYSRTGRVVVVCAAGHDKGGWSGA